MPKGAGSETPASSATSTATVSGCAIESLAMSAGRHDPESRLFPTVHSRLYRPEITLVIFGANMIA